MKINLIRPEDYTSNPQSYDYLTRIMKIDSIGDKKLINIIKNLKPKLVCEVGCGTGFITKKLAKNKSFEFLVTDVNPEFIKFAQKRLSNINFFLFNAIKDTLPKKADIVFARFVYHHIQDKKKISFLKNLRRNGNCIILLDYFLPENKNKKEAIKQFHQYRKNLLKNNRKLIEIENITEKLALNNKEEYKVSLSKFYSQINHSDLIIKKHFLIKNKHIKNPTLFGLHLFCLESKNDN